MKEKWSNDTRGIHYLLFIYPIILKYIEIRLDIERLVRHHPNFSPNRLTDGVRNNF